MSVEHRSVEATATSTDNVRVAACDVDIARFYEPCWDALPKRARMQALDDASRWGIGSVGKSSNTTCVELDELRVDSLKKGAPAAADQIITELALGTDGTQPEHGNRALNSEYVRIEVTEFVDNGSSLTVRIFVAKEEANGASSDLTELGLYAGDYDHFLNHSLFTAIDKTNGIAVTFEIDLVFDTA